MIRSLTTLLAALGLAAPATAQLIYDLDGPVSDDATTGEEEQAADEAVPAEEDAPVQSTPAAADALAEQVNRAIVACFYQTLDDEGRATQAALAERGVTFSDEAPQAVRDLANAEALGGARYVQWDASGAVIWLIAYTQAPACRIMVAETPLAQASRGGIERRLLESGLWVKDEAQSTTTEGIRRQIFNFDAEDSPNRLVLSITGPVAIERDGDGLQLMISIAAFPRPGQTPAEQPAQEPGR